MEKGLNGRTNSLQLAKLYANDPVLRLFKDGLHLTPVWFGVIGLLFWASTSYGLAMLMGYARTSADFIGAFDERGIVISISYIFFIYPIIWAFYLWQPTLISHTLESLRRNGVIGPASSEPGKPVSDRKSFDYPDFVNELVKAFNNGWWPTLAAFFVVGLGLVFAVSIWPTYQPAVMGKPLWWYSNKPYLFLVRLPLLLLTWYMFVMFLIREILAIVWFNRLFASFEAQVRPLHADNCGGLGAIGDFSIWSTVLAIAISVNLIIETLTPTFYGKPPNLSFEIMSGYGLYILLVPSLLLAPIWAAHQAMKRARDAELFTIAEEFEATLVAAQAGLQRDSKTIEEDNDKMDQLQARYDMILKTFPVWPFSTSALRNFSITASIPPLLGTASFVIEFFRNLF
ncbi:MAG: hypothetical protein ACE5NP_06470 [Anaerolineae bacterium]